MNVRGLQVAIIAAATVGGCVKVEKFSFRDAGPLGGEDASDANGDAGTGSGGAIASMVGDHVEVELPGLYTMVFSAEGYHFPKELHIGNEQLFGSTPGTCSSEQGVGVAYVPAALFTSVDTPGLTKQPSTIKIDLEGPGIARVTLDWEATFSNPSPCTGAPSGRSVFTFFPDGRIQRMDAARLDANANATDCRCSDLSDSSWDIETIYSFKTSVVNQILGITAPPATDGANVTITEPTVCINPAAQDFQIAIAWRGHTSRRVRRIDAAASYAFIGDMALPGAMSGTGLLGDTSTTLIIGTNTDCPTLRARAAPYADDVHIDISLDGGPIITGGFGLGQDGLYGGEHSQSGVNHGFAPGGASIEITPRTPATTTPPFGIWLELEQRTVTSVTRMPANVPAVHTLQEFADTQMQGIGEFVLWIPDGLGEGESIIIETSP